MRTINAFLFSFAVSALGIMWGGFANAQTPASPAANTAPVELAGKNITPIVQGKTNDGKVFNLANLKGKVALVMFWSTDCAVCRDKMPELRENYKGWAGKPFEMVLISVDRRMKDVNDYEVILNRMVPMQQRFVQLWSGEAGYQDNLSSNQLQRSQLPATFLVDKAGKIVERYNGRIPAQVWDSIADLL